jgi:cullin-associated NEDD8-dissociated protein 1
LIQKLTCPSYRYVETYAIGKELLTILQMYLEDKTPSVRAMVIQAIRYTLPDSDETFDAVLRTILIDMLITMLHDAELENRRLALTTLNSATHNKPDLILPHLAQLLPLVMKESVVKPELIREVMMGPFKHKVDDGLEVRKVTESDISVLK